VRSFMPPPTDSHPWRTHFGADKTTLLVKGIAAFVNIIVTLANVITALVNCTMALTNSAMALVNAATALINGIRTYNGIAVLVDGPSHLQLHSQPSPGASNSISMAKAVSAPIRQPDSSAVDLFFLKGTMHSSFQHILSNPYSFSHPKMTFESPTAMPQVFIQQPCRRTADSTSRNPAVISSEAPC